MSRFCQLCASAHSIADRRKLFALLYVGIAIVTVGCILKSIELFLEYDEKSVTCGLGADPMSHLRHRAFAISIRVAQHHP